MPSLYRASTNTLMTTCYNGYDNCWHPHAHVCGSAAVVIGFRDAGYTVTEGERVDFVVEKTGIIDMFIFFSVIIDVDDVISWSSAGSFQAGGMQQEFFSIPFFAFSFDDDIALEEDVVLPLNLTLETPITQIITRNTLIPVTVVDDDGIYHS